MTDEQFHAHRTMLANDFATAGAELLEFMRAPGTMAAIPNTSPEQYVVAGDLTAIQALLPNRRERRGQRPDEDLYWGAEAGQRRRWTILVTEGGKGVVADYGYSFPDAKPEFERVDVVEVATPTATNTAGAVPSIDTPEFHGVLKAYRNSTIDFSERKAELIAHIDAHVQAVLRSNQEKGGE